MVTGEVDRCTPDREDDMAHTMAAVPAHVPPEMVFSYNPYTDPMFEQDPFAAMANVKRAAPEIFFSPELEGFWCVTTYEDIREVMRNAEIFSSAIAGIPNKKRPVTLKPLQLDPPEHNIYRKLLAPLFTPQAMAAWEPRIRELARDLIAAFAKRGGCEFIEEFAAKLPNLVFAMLMGLPSDQLDTLLTWEKAMVRGSTQAEMDEAGRNVLNYITEHFAQRKSMPRQDDITSYLIDQGLSDADLQSVGFLLYIAGLDTVQSMLGFIFLQLGRDMDFQSMLRASSEHHQTAIEEMLRLNSIVNPNRTLAADYEFRGVKMLKGDRIMCSGAFANVDPATFEGGAAPDPAREFNPHLTFGAGPHRCLGSHLARREIAIAIEEMNAALPTFKVDKDKPFSAGGGSVFYIGELHLKW